MRKKKMQEIDLSLIFTFTSPKRPAAASQSPGALGEIACLRKRNLKAMKCIFFVDCRSIIDDVKGAICA